MRKLTLAVAAILCLSLSTTALQTAKKTDAEIRQLVINESIAAYKGSCPCPYNTDKAGKSCGARSAYSKPGGASPLCYDKDVTEKMVGEYRKKHGV